MCARAVSIESDLCPESTLSGRWQSYPRSEFVQRQALKAPQEPSRWPVCHCRHRAGLADDHRRRSIGHNRRPVVARSSCLRSAVRRPDADLPRGVILRLVEGGEGAGWWLGSGATPNAASESPTRFYGHVRPASHADPYVATGRIGEADWTAKVVCNSTKLGG
jgi:hypothetical protein